MAIIGRTPSYQPQLQGLTGQQRRDFLVNRPQIAAQQAQAYQGGMANRIQDRMAYLQSRPKLMAQRAAAGGKIAQAALTSSVPPTQLPPQQQQQAVSGAMDQAASTGNGLATNPAQQQGGGFDVASWGTSQGLTPQQIASFQQALASAGISFPNAR